MVISTEDSAVATSKFQYLYKVFASPGTHPVMEDEIHIRLLEVLYSLVMDRSGEFIRNRILSIKLLNKLVINGINDLIAAADAFYANLNTITQLTGEYTSEVFIRLSGNRLVMLNKAFTAISLILEQDFALYVHVESKYKTLYNILHDIWTKFSSNNRTWELRSYLYDKGAFMAEKKLQPTLRTPYELSTAGFVGE